MITAYNLSPLLTKGTNLIIFAYGFDVQQLHHARVANASHMCSKCITYVQQLPHDKNILRKTFYYEHPVQHVSYKKEQNFRS